MKFIFILIDKTETKNVSGFYERKEMTLTEANHLNEDLTNGTIWILTPNY
jgi:hypothetical protein